MTTPGKAAQAYQVIEQMIVFQDLDPGSLVSEAFLMEKTGLGRTPVREALQRLSRNHMVEIHPNKGVLIPATSVEAQLRMLELRRSLESLAVELACERATASERRDIEAMATRIREDDFTLKEYAETVKATHQLIASSAHNDYLADAMAPLQGLSRRFWFTHVVDEVAEIKAGAALHIAMLEAILASDVDAATAASAELNDYLVDFALGTLNHSPARR
ncbi:MULTISPECIES: GntR family transcriptional regulator [unclassified Nocardioides]|uniref:GntR family transcriptional regulator n=1 Tax=unclassified Nocardioides TaxID=2615069 RepID=UPI0006FB1280|nr:MULTISPECIES: GntR family transcriptional regulator [unclassified Nocardioides]KQY62460.1 GntR family transcriptional regulator [Nocardioides sp. Root140]KRF16912.1 GntR family transcriptional regulator [Nocardioides sp. Soil796]